MAKKKKEVEEKTIETVTRGADAEGNRFLPGAEQEFKVIPELAEAIKENKNLLVPQFMAAKKALEDSKARIVDLGEKYKEELPMNEEGTKRVYNDGETWLDIAVKDSIEFGVV